MNFIFVCSYLNVPNAIETIEREKDSFRILSSNPRILRLFSELYSSKYIIELPKLFTSFSNVVVMSRDVFRMFWYKHKTLTMCRKLEPQKIFFYYLGWNGFESWLIKKLSKNTKVYHRLNITINNIHDNNTVKQRIKTIVACFLYGIPFKSIYFFDHPMIVIDSQFLNMIKAKKYTNFESDNLIRGFIERRFDDYKDIKILLLTGQELNMISSEYDAGLKKVLEILLKKYQLREIGFKLHPDARSENIPWLKHGIIISKHLPANLLCYKCVAVISYASATLFEAANIGKKAISLVHIIPSVKKGQAEKYENYLLENVVNKNGIAFPKTHKDLQSVISTL